MTVERTPPRRQTHAPGHGDQQPLPFDDEADAPIGLCLTAAAHRRLAPTSVPPLRLVGHGRQGADTPTGEAFEGEAGAGDTRPARARALRRGGLDIAEIVRRLGVDDLLVRAWLDEPALDGPTGAGGSRPSTAAHEEATASGLARAEATRAARIRLGTDPEFAVGVGLLAGLAEISEPGCTLRLGSLDVGARVFGWLRRHADLEDAHVRIVLRLGRRAAGDLARHQWARALDVPRESITVVRSRRLVDPLAVEALTRLHAPEVAARVAGWCDAVLTRDDDDVGVAF